MSVQVNEEIAGGIRARLARTQITQADLARRTEIPRSTIGAICRGEIPITVDVLATIAEALGGRAGEFFPPRLDTPT